jgi:hypothetical protein
MSRKHFIELAECCVNAIKFGYVKKKDMDNYIGLMCNFCSRQNYNFSYDRFERYIKERI